MKNLLIKLGLWEKATDYGSVTKSFYEASIGNDFHREALKHYCDKCDRWFERYVGKLSHERAAHEGVFKKDRSKDA